jgi:hypothetical protein
MTLDEIFEKYPDNKTGFYRKYNLDQYKKYRTEFSEKDILERINKHDVKWLKGLKAWGNEQSKELGFIIPVSMIEDANADDWELSE